MSCICGWIQWFFGSATPPDAVPEEAANALPEPSAYSGVFNNLPHPSEQTTEPTTIEPANDSAANDSAANDSAANDSAANDSAALPSTANSSPVSLPEAEPESSDVDPPANQPVETAALTAASNLSSSSNDASPLQPILEQISSRDHILTTPRKPQRDSAQVRAPRSARDHLKDRKERPAVSESSGPKQQTTPVVRPAPPGGRGFVLPTVPAGGFALRKVGGGAGSPN